MCDKAILENGGTSEFVPDCYKNKQMCDEAVDNYSHALKFVLDCYNAICCLMLKKGVIKLLIDVFMYLIVLLIGIKLKKYVAELFLKISF